MAVSLTTAIGYLNESLTTLGYGQEFQINPSGTDAEITAALKAIGTLAPSQINKIMEQMNLVVQNRNFGVMFDAEKNKFRAFIINLTETGFGIEDLFHELIEGIEPLWDDKSSAANTAILEDLVSYDTNKIDKAFHTSSFERQFKTTVDVRNYNKVFTTVGLTRYVDTKLANLQWSAEVYLMGVVIGVIKKMITDSHIVFGNEIDPTGNGININTKLGVLNAVERIKSTVDGFLTPCAEYNYGAAEWDSDNNVIKYIPVVNMSESKNDIFIVTRPDYMERLKVQGYSNAFNLSEFELEGRIIYVPAGTTLGTHTYTNGDGDTVTEDVQFVVLDRRAILAGIRYWLGSSKFIENVHRVNHWLTVEGIKGYNTFFNAVAFTGEEFANFLEDEGVKASDIFVGAISDDTDADFSLIKNTKVIGGNSSTQNCLVSGTNVYLASCVCKEGDTIQLSRTSAYCTMYRYKKDGSHTTTYPLASDVITLTADDASIYFVINKSSKNKEAN